MNTRKIIGGATAVAFAVASVLVMSTGAHADEVPVDETTAVVEVVETVVEAPAEPAPEPVDPPAAPETPPPAPEPVSEPVAPPVPEPAPVVAEKVELSSQPDFICDEAGEGWSEKIDTDGDPETVTVQADEGFLIDAYCVKAGSGEGAKHIITVDPPASEVVIDHPTKDSVSHYQVHQIEEPVTEVPTPRACVGVGAWYTEGDDLPPVQIEEGLLFEGGTGKAVGIRVPVDGNLQGWTSVSFENTGGQEQFFFRIVINASADGGKAYQSLSFPGYTTIDSNSISYQFGETIAETAARFPNAVITSVVFQTNSGAPAGYEAVLSSVTGPCATLDFTLEPLPENYSVEGEWTAGEYDCDDTSYEETRVVTSYTYSRDEEGNVVETVEETTESRTIERVADCPVVVTPPPAPPAPPAPASNTTTTPLAATGGGDVSPLIPFGALGALMVGAMAILLGRRARLARQD